MAGKIVFVTGGARSGKSCFAEQYALHCGGKVAYIATARIWDEEMRQRIARHQARRPSEWTTYEAPEKAERVIVQAGRAHEVILFDCLTLYLSQLLCALPGETEAGNQGAAMPGLNDAEGVRRYVLAIGTKLLQAARESGRSVIFVSNEVGAGIVPINQLARVYRDAQGLLNQQFAAAAQEAYFTVSGMALDLKKLAVSIGVKEAEA